MSAAAPLVTEETLGKVVKGAGELSLPGFSLYLDRKIGEAALHTVAGLAAATVFGPLGYVLVGANSFSKSVSGRTLVDRLATKTAARESAEVTTARKTSAK
ncbi:hypothetical protein HNQ77_003080 [Silvibacterium bohemicum]|uniref:Uncharacterized protein n=1 Tax=Silvibacterium bohemicum TaxID=1577686 RepID=A0A841JUR1_9BACT|nr:DUF6072 family protein [Silvibacterium bohemicum]MBB6145122.1 hypothetical protein [Silvibacterium bohemicum]